MNDFDQALQRLAARELARALPTRTSSSLTDDPDVTIGIATIKIVTEEQVQAIAFGRIGDALNLVIRMDPISRDVTDLGPFASFLSQVADEAQRDDGALRVWIPHDGTLETLDVLGHRYWRNQNAPEPIRRMGELCRIIAFEHGFPGQQTVADSTGLLREHLITGLSPIEEGHLNAMLAWTNPTVTDPLEESRRRIRIPATGVLPNTPDQALDDRIDRLRREAKSASGRRRDLLQSQIADILSSAVLYEWELMVEARNVFRRLGLSSSGLEKLATASSRRVFYALEQGFFPARAPERLAIELSEKEVSQGMAEQLDVETDLALREQAVNSGAIIDGAISEVVQPQRGKKPCNISVDTNQSVIRLRRDDKVKVLNSNVKGVVRSIEKAPNGGIRVGISVENGVRSRDVLAVGNSVSVIEEGFGFSNIRAFAAARDRQPWQFYSDTAPAVPAMLRPVGSLLEIARGSRNQ